jgi:hypothetical protein
MGIEPNGTGREQNGTDKLANGTKIHKHQVVFAKSGALITEHLTSRHSKIKENRTNAGWTC